MSGFGYDVLGFGSGAGVAPPEVDDEFNRVAFLSHFDGANNGDNKAFDDGSASNHTITDSVSPAQGSFSPFARPDGEWSFNNAASENNTFNVTSHDNFDMTNPFTIEGWIFLSEVGVNTLLFGRENNYWMTQDYQGIGGASGKFGFHSFNNGNSWVSINASAATVANTWYFLQATYVGTTVTFYINGVSQGTASVGSPSSNTDKPFYVLSMSNTTYVGNASNVRLSSVARSTSLPTAKFTSDSDTELLVCQSNRFVDNGPDGHTITTTAGASVSAFGPFLTDAAYDPAVNGASVHLDGAGDSISAASSADFAFGTGDFTVEFWVYQKEVKNYTIYFDNRTSNNQATLELYQSSNGAFDLYINATSHAFTPPSVLNRWAHFAISRASSTTKLFVDGVQYLSFSDSTDYVCPNRFYVGRLSISDLYHLNGYMSDFRLVKGTAVYTSAFTPPTAPLTAITNTKLLLNMANGQAINSAAQNNMTLIGGAKISTGQAKFGDTSMYFDGASDHAKFQNTQIGAGDFTIECWVFCLGSTYDKGVWDNHTSSGSSDGLTLTRITEQQFRLFGTGELIRSGNFTITNTWVNVTVVRSSGTLNLFVNGVSQGTTSFTTNLNSAADFVIGGGRYAGDPTTGAIDAYVDEFRISHMARYTSNFTVSDEPFPNQGQV